MGVEFCCRETNAGARQMFQGRFGAASERLKDLLAICKGQGNVNPPLPAESKQNLKQLSGPEKGSSMPKTVLSTKNALATVFF